MGKQIVVCCDGTWDVPDERSAGVAAPTNVAKLALGVVCGEGTDQLLYYEPGVGTTPDERLLGGAFGYGLSRNVRNCYRFLAEHYDDGDLLFLFGFSRGAYTARSLAGLIRNCGILCQDNAGEVDEAFAFYRDRTSTTHPDALASTIFRRMYSHQDEQIHFIGVWDTVGALGIPEGVAGWDHLDKVVPDWEQLWGFHDTQLNRHVANAYHALAIDETRPAFRPTLWTQDPAATQQKLEQVWFSGVHTEVGGGAADASLSDIALLWMVEKATDCGLKIEPGRLQVGADDGAQRPLAPQYAGPLEDQRLGPLALLGAYHRLEVLPVTDAPAQSIASSAARRASERIDGYAPRGLQTYLNALGTTPVTEEAGPATALAPPQS